MLCWLYKATPSLTIRQCSMYDLGTHTGSTYMHMHAHVMRTCACRELWDGPRAGADDAVEFTGVDEVRHHITCIYCNLSFLRHSQ